MTISGDYLFVTLILLALGLMLFHMRERTVLLAFASSMVWFALGMWLFFSSSPPLDLSNNYVQILAMVFFGVLIFIPWVNQMNTEIRHEAGNQRWSTWGARPGEEQPTGYAKYRIQLHRVTRGKTLRRRR